MNILKRMLYIIMLLALMTPGAFAQETTQDIAISDIQDDGIIRVYLKSLGDPEALYLTLAGEYTVEGSSAMRFERGAEVIVTADGDDVCLTAGGLTLNMGGDFTLTRCAAEDGAENGIYIYESERNALYQGDLRIGCKNGALRPVLLIAMEDYLTGVVAYEMSDSFPLEALKAQAVAARTYAMSRKSARVGAEYDVTDTTSDQVYKGFIGDYTNVIAAVEETAGIVGTYNGYYATCYYTASNGGQIATPNQIWGGDGDYGYIVQKDDPYDLENSLSLMNSFEVASNCDADNLFWQLIDAKLDKSGHTELRADAITKMELTEPAHEGSKMYKTLEVTLAVSARDEGLVEIAYEGDVLLGWALGYAHIGDGWYKWGLKDWESLEAPAKVTFSVYDEIKDGLNIGINSSDYEVPSISETDGGYVIEMRRFGHGVGMSQRGAQTMAGSHGKSFMEILNFYYPGMTFEAIAWNSPALPEMEELPREIAQKRLLIPPREVDLGELSEGEYFARVNLETAKSRLNVRTAPSTDAAIAVKLDDGYRVAVCEDAGDGWVRIRGGSFTGYVKQEYLTAE
jgi:stage II sporulation protein D